MFEVMPFTLLTIMEAYLWHHEGVHSSSAQSSADNDHISLAQDYQSVIISAVMLLWKNRCSMSRRCCWSWPLWSHHCVFMSVFQPHHGVFAPVCLLNPPGGHGHNGETAVETPRWGNFSFLIVFNMKSVQNHISYLLYRSMKYFTRGEYNMSVALQVLHIHSWRGIPRKQESV